MKATSEFIDYTINSELNVDSGYPGSNLNIRDTATIEMRSLDLTETQIEFSLGSVITDPTVLLYAANFSDYRIENNDASYNSGILNTEQHRRLFLYKHTFLHSGFSDSLLRLIIPAQSTTDGASVFKLGIVTIQDTLEDFQAAGEGMGLNFDWEWVISEDVTQAVSGRQDIQTLGGTPFGILNLSPTQKNDKALEAKMSKVFNHPLRKVAYVDINKVGKDDYFLMFRSSSMGVSENFSHDSYSINLRTVL